MVRADAALNKSRIVAAAAATFAERGEDASLEEIARRAGVGSATLHRHFGTRASLLAEVFANGIYALCDRGAELGTTDDAAAALITWLTDLAVFAASTKGLAAELMEAPASVGEPTAVDHCYAQLAEAGQNLLSAAQQAGVVDSEVSVGEVLALITAIASSTGKDPSGAAARRLVSLSLGGVVRQQR
jgi:AcrR family transcriptional regulator